MLRVAVRTRLRFTPGPGVRPIVTGPFPRQDVSEGPYLDFVLENADKFADRPAIVDGVTGQRIRYSELKSLVQQVASGLARRRLGRGQTLTIFAGNCWESVVAYHGVLATGAAVNLISNHATSCELSGQLRQVRPRFLLVTPEVVDTATRAAHEVGGVEDIFVVGDGAPPHGCRRLHELLTDDGAASPWGRVEIDAGHDVAVMSHSSGTTGLPKTVLMTHSAMRANLELSEPLVDLRAGAETLLAVLPFFHSYTRIKVFALGLRRGATIVLLPGFQPESMLRAIETWRVTYMDAVPPLVHFLLDSPLAAQFDLRSVRTVFCSGAPLHAKTEREMRDKFGRGQPEFALYQGYGSTETNFVTVPPRGDARVPHKVGTIGVPLPNTELRVVKVGTDEDAAPGEEGELLLRGPQLMKGYLNAPDATRAAFRDGWFLTGDVGYYDEDAFFYVSDRVKELIKYKGNQVAPAEVESVLMRHPGVADCCVVGRAHEVAGELPTAFVVRSAPVEALDLTRLVADTLSPAKRLRGGVVFVDAIPRSASGKLLRKVLRERLNR